MPKMKSHSGAKKRFKVTGSGKLMHRQANLGHLNAHKPSKRLRRLKGNTELAGSDLKQAKGAPRRLPWPLSPSRPQVHQWAGHDRPKNKE